MEFEQKKGWCVFHWTLKKTQSIEWNRMKNRRFFPSPPHKQVSMVTAWYCMRLKVDTHKENCPCDKSPGPKGQVPLSWLLRKSSCGTKIWYLWLVTWIVKLAWIEGAEREGLEGGQARSLFSRSPTNTTTPSLCARFFSVEKIERQRTV